MMTTRSAKHSRGLRVLTAGAVAAVGLLVGLPATAAGAATPPEPATGWIRFAHFSPASGPVTVTVDGQTLTSNAAFESVTPYLSVPAGTHNVAVVDSGKAGPALAGQALVTPGGAETVAAVGAGTGTQLQIYTDDLAPTTNGQSRVRIIHTVAGVPAVDVLLTATPADVKLSAPASDPAQVEIPAVPFGSASPYRSVPSGTYQVSVNANGGQQIVSGRDWPVASGTVASIAVVQGPSGPTLEVLRDAVGAASAPVGAMATGFGGTAAKARPTDVNYLAVVILGGVASAALILCRRRRGKGRPGKRPIAVLALLTLAAAGCASGNARAAKPESGDAPIVVPQGAANPPLVGESTVVNLAGFGTGATASQVPPTAISIAAIGVHAPIVTLGLDADGSAQVPSRTDVVGWYDAGPAPGQAGPAVLLAHVDSTTGPGAFYHLKDLTPGATVVVTEGSTALTFQIQRVQTYAKADFPTAAIFGPVPDRALRLVTCGGPFDRVTGHYLDNVVAFATAIGSSTTSVP